MIYSLFVSRYPKNYTHRNHLLSITDRELIQRAINNNSTVILAKVTNHIRQLPLSVMNVVDTTSLTFIKVLLYYLLLQK